MLVSGCSKSSEGVKKYLGMKGAPSREYEKKFPESKAAKGKDLRLPPVSAQTASQPAPAAQVLSGPTTTAPAASSALESAARKIAEKVVETFPRVQGYLVDVKEGRVYLNLGARDGIKEGAVLDLIRKGAEFKHPYTGQVLGTFEENIGALKVLEVKDDYSVAETISLRKGAAVKAGDMARIKSARIKLAVLPFYVPSDLSLSQEQLTAALVKSLKETGKFDLYDMDALKVWMLEQSLKPADLNDEKAVKRVLEGIQSEWYLINSAREVQETIVVESRLISAHNDAPVVVAQALLEEAKPLEMGQAPPGPQGPPATAYTPPIRQQVAEERSSVRAPISGGSLSGRRAVYQGDYATSQKFDFEVMGMAVGDVDGDGKKEVVLAGKDRVEILRWSGEKFQSLHSYNRGKEDVFFVSVDLADLNGNGRQEIYVSNFPEDKARSFVLEVKGNKLEMLQNDLFQLLRVVSPPGQEPMLLGQYVHPAPSALPVMGKIERFAWKGKKLEKTSQDGALKNLPREVNIYSMNLADLDGDGAEDIIAMSDSGKLDLYNRNGKTLWESSEDYGGKIIRTRPQTKLDISKEVTEEYYKALSPVNPKVILRDLDGDGKLEVIVAKNIPAMGGALKGLGGFGDSKLLTLRWNGVTLVEDWETQKLGGYVTDIAIVDIDNDGQDELAASVVFKSGFLGLSRDSAIYIFEFLWQ